MFYDEVVLPAVQVETLKATTGGKPITYKIAYGLPVEVMLEWGLYISKPRCALLRIHSCARHLPPPKSSPILNSSYGPRKLVAPLTLHRQPRPRLSSTVTNLGRTPQEPP